MPELPEVTITSRQLHAECAGWILDSVVQLAYLPKFEFCLALPLRIEAVGNRGKYIIFNLEGGKYLVSHMLLYGSWSLEWSSAAAAKISISNAHGEEKSLYFSTRKGLGIISSEMPEVAPSITDTTAEQFCLLYSKRGNRSIYSVLLDQGVVSGIGNYIACEALALVSVSPRSKTAQVDLGALCLALKLVCNRSIRCGGVSISDYSDLYGKRGTYQNEFACYGIASKVQIAGKTAYSFVECNSS